VSYSSEADHLKEFSEEEREERLQTAREMFANGKSKRGIAKELGVTEGTIRYWLRNA
jgi:transposase